MFIDYLGLSKGKMQVNNNFETLPVVTNKSNRYTTKLSL